MDEFDFCKWLKEHELHDIKECFTDCGMSALDTLDMNHTNFVELMADERVLSSPHLIQNIVHALQSLQKSQTSVPLGTTERRLIFMTPTEHNIFITIENYIHRLNELRNELQTTTHAQIHNRKQKNNINIDSYTTRNTLQLDGIRNTIKHTTDELHDILTRNEEILTDALKQYRKTAKCIAQTHTKRVHNMENILTQCLSMIGEDVVYLAKSIEECKEIVHQYEEDDDSNTSDYSLQRCNSGMRETDIAKIGTAVTDYYNKNLIIFNANQHQINDYIENQLILDLDCKYSITIYDAIYDTLCSHIATLVQTQTIGDEWEEEDSLSPVSVKNAIAAVLVEVDHNEEDEVAAPPMAFAPQNYDIQMQPIQAGVDPRAAVVLVEVDHNDGEDDEEEKEPPPPYNPKAKAVPKHVILQMEKSVSVKNAIAAKAKPVPMRKYKSEGAKKKKEGAVTDAHVAWGKLDPKSAKGKPESFEKYWTCSVCTFAENPGTFLMCGVCQNSRQLSLQKQHSLSDGGSQPYLQQSMSEPKARHDSDSAKVEFDADKKGAHVKRSQTVSVANKNQSKKRGKLFGWSKNKKKSNEQV
eukprot:667925_1